MMLFQALVLTVFVMSASSIADESPPGESHLIAGLVNNMTHLMEWMVEVREELVCQDEILEKNSSCGIRPAIFRTVRDIGTLMEWMTEIRDRQATQEEILKKMVVRMDASAANTTELQIELHELRNKTQTYMNVFPDSIANLTSQLHQMAVRMDASAANTTGLQIELQEMRNKVKDEVTSIKKFVTVTEGAVRLVNGKLPWEGRLEIFHAGGWGTVCDDEWTNTNAQVVCRQLGYSASNAYFNTSAPFGEGTGPIWMDDVKCDEDRNALQQCTHRGFGVEDCDHGQDVGVTCGCAVNCESCATNGPGKCDPGYCDDGYHLDFASTCQLIPPCDFKVYENKHARGATRNTSVNTLDVCQDACRQNVTCTAIDFNFKFSQCWIHSTDASKLIRQAYDSPHVVKIHHYVKQECVTPATLDATPASEGAIRLVNGPSPRAGRLEIFHNGQWGTVCDDMWNNGGSETWGPFNALVVCRQLGYSTVNAKFKLGGENAALYGRGSGSIWLDAVKCHVNKSKLHECSHRGWGVHNCDHGEDVGVICEE